MDARDRAWAREQIVQRAGKDREFRAELLTDPRAAIAAAFGQELPADLEVRVFEDTDSTFFVVLPFAPPHRESKVSLREVTADNVRALCALEVAPEQKQFVAPNAISIAEGNYSPKAWMRAIYADDVPVGFVMLLDDPETPRYYVWRYMIAAEYQGMGFGLRALEQVIDYVRGRPGAAVLSLSYVPGDGSAAAFYERLGFRDTGEQHGGENVMRLTLNAGTE